MGILVTGAGGFTGGHLVRHLVASLPRGTDPRSIRAMVRSEKQSAFLKSLGVSIVEADLTDRESLRRAIEGVTKIYHIGALFRQAGVPDQAFHDVNVQGTRNVFELGIEAGVTRIIHCSTVGVLGDVSAPPGTELSPYAPGDIYQQTKMEGEQLALEFYRSGKMGGVVIRPAMIYGPGDQRTLKLFKRINDRRFFYVGDGKKRVHFVDVRDLARAFSLAMERTDRNGEIYIIGGRTSKPLVEFVGAVADYLGVPAPKLHVPVVPMQMLGLACEIVCKPFGIEPPIFRRRVDFFTKHREFDCSKAKRELCYYPKNSLHEEIREICTWYLDNGWITAKGSQKPVAPPATIIRGLDGQIAQWDSVAERHYGWKADEAIGSVTHSLLNTEFPLDLETINREILTRRVWEGSLWHTNRQGDKVQVHSRWEYVGDSPDRGYVIERNQVIDSNSEDRRKISDLRYRTHSFIPMLPELIESGILGSAGVMI